MKHPCLAIAVVMATTSATSVAAQQSIHLGVAGGAVFPVGKLDSTYSAGRSGLVTLAIGPQDTPIGLRLDYQYDEFNGKTIGGATVPGMHISSVTANLVLAFRVGYVKPYIIGGGGLYPFRAFGETKRENDWGANGGVGLGFPIPYTTIGAFIEARYHDVNRSNTSSYHFIPVTFGILF
ncbi:MAG TPA: hypothetical protein VII66_03450 [Gemmatimonadaceae bacterium]